MCVFVSRPMTIVTFLLKNGEATKWVVDFLGKNTFRNTIMEIVENFDEKSYNNNNGKPWKSSRILRVNPNFFIFLSFFIIFLHFSPFFRFFYFSFSFIFFHFLSFYHFFFSSGAQNLFFFWASISLRFLLTILMCPSRRVHLWALFSFFSSFFSSVFCLFCCCLFFMFFSFFVHFFIFNFFNVFSFSFFL